MKLSAEEYCQLFRMDQPYFNFNRKEFIKRFGLDFLDSLKDHYNNQLIGYPKYSVFKNEISQAQNIFNSISELVEKAGKKPLSKGLWNVFYATYVINSRKILFKNIQEKIDHKKKVAEVRWASLKGLSEKLHLQEDNVKKHSHEYKTKNKPSEK